MLIESLKISWYNVNSLKKEAINMMKTQKIDLRDVLADYIAETGWEAELIKGAEKRAEKKFMEQSKNIIKLLKQGKSIEAIAQETSVDIEKVKDFQDMLLN